MRTAHDVSTAVPLLQRTKRVLHHRDARRAQFLQETGYMPGKNGVLRPGYRSPPPFPRCGAVRWGPSKYKPSREVQVDSLPTLGDRGVSTKKMGPLALRASWHAYLNKRLSTRTKNAGLRPPRVRVDLAEVDRAHRIRARRRRLVVGSDRVPHEAEGRQAASRLGVRSWSHWRCRKGSLCQRGPCLPDWRRARHARRRKVIGRRGKHRKKNCPLSAVWKQWVTNKIFGRPLRRSPLTCLPPPTTGKESCRLLKHGVKMQVMDHRLNEATCQKRCAIRIRMMWNNKLLVDYVDLHWAPLSSFFMYVHI